jgi:uncharacterized protein YjdB
MAGKDIHVTNDSSDKETEGSMPWAFAQVSETGDRVIFDTEQVQTITYTGTAATSISKSNIAFEVIGNGIVMDAAPGTSATTAPACIFNGNPAYVEDIHFRRRVQFSGTLTRVVNCTFEPGTIANDPLVQISNNTFLEGCAFLLDEPRSFRISTTSLVHLISCTYINNTGAACTFFQRLNNGARSITLTNCVIIDPHATGTTPTANLDYSGCTVTSYGYNVIQGAMKVNGADWNAWKETDLTGAGAGSSVNLENTLVLEDEIYKVKAGGLAYLHLPALTGAGLSDEIVARFPEKDLSGTEIHYGGPTHSGAWQASSGTFDDEPVVTEIRIPAFERGLFFSDTTYRLQAALDFEGGDVTQEVTWAVNNPNVTIEPTAGLTATFHAENITEEAQITVTVTAKNKGRDTGNEFYAQDFPLTLKPYIHVTGITVEGDATLIYGYDQPLTATVAPADANWQEVEWSVDDGGAAGLTVDPATGAVTLKGLAEGTATVTVTAHDNGVVGTFDVDVRRADYSDGVFILNEDWYGTVPNSSINYLDPESGRIDYHIFQHANYEGPGYTLGVTSQYGTIYGGKFYIMSKQGIRLIVADARTMELQRGFGMIGGDGRFFFGADERTGYVGTSGGLRIVDLDALPDVPGGMVSGVTTYPKMADNLPGEDVEALASGANLYSGQVTTMKRVGERVFVLQQGDLHVLNAATRRLETTLTDHRYVSMTQSLDGNLWFGTSGKTPSGNIHDEDEADLVTNYFVRLDPWTLERAVVSLPEGIHGTAITFGAWQADAFSGSTTENVLYWKGGSKMYARGVGEAEIHGMVIYRYDIDASRVDTVLDITGMAVFSDEVNEPWSMYGTALGVHPATGELYVTVGTYAINGEPLHRNNWKVLRVDPHRDRGASGMESIVREYSLMQHFWFPAMPVFPDRYRPEFIASKPFPDAVTLDADHSTARISFGDRIEDRDNMTASIVATVLDGHNTSLINARIWRDTLVVAARRTIAAGQPSESTVVTLKFNSNGHVITKEIPVTVEAGASTVTHPFELNTHALSLNAAQTAQLSLTYPDEYTVTWYSENEDIALVSNTGRVVGIAEGTTRIIAEDRAKNRYDVCTVTVLPSIVWNPFELDVHSLTLDIAEFAQLRLTAPEQYSVTWRSLDENVAMVGSTGRVLAVAEGTTQIIAEDKARGKSDACTVTVRPRSVQYTISLNHTLLVMNEGERTAIRATVSPAATVTWQSARPAIADVTSDGTVIALMPGNTDIIAALPDGTSATCNVTVRDVDVTADALDILANSATLSFPRLSGTTYYLIHLFEVSGDERIPEVAIKLNPDGTIANIVGLRATATNIKLVVNGLRPLTTYEADIDVVREISGTEEVVTVMKVRFITDSPTGNETPGLREASAWYAAGALRLANLEGYKVEIYNLNGQTVAVFNVHTFDEVHRQAFPKGIYFLKAEKPGYRKTLKFIVY